MKTLAIALIICLSFQLEAQQARLKYSLNDSLWTFLKQDDTNAVKVDYDESSWLNVSIPHDWNGGIDGVNNDVYNGPSMYQGLGWYRLHFSLDSSYMGRKLFITFEAVSLQADVWLNEDYLGNHKGGYTAFGFDITSSVNLNGENILAVRASNANDPKVAPWMLTPYGAYPNSSDYAVYGGIYRDVWLTVADTINIVSEKHSAFDISETSANIAMNIKLKNYGSVDTSVTLITEILDSANNVISSVSDDYAIDSVSEINIDRIMTTPNPSLWSPSNPYLYKIRTKLLKNSIEIDRLESTLGIRRYTLRNGEPFKINGENLFLRGVNRHQDRLGYGYAQSNQQHKEDIALIKSLGFNFLRHAHYPCDPAILEACDSLGILVWLEIPVSTCISPDTNFLINARMQMREMIEERYNHPSIIVWGLGNESDQSSASSQSYTNTFFDEINQVAHDADSTRPTVGCNFKYTSNQAIPDVYAPQNWDGWYGGVYTSYLPEKLIGEYGADSHIPSHNETFAANSGAKPWTQEYACKLLEYKTSVGESRKNLFPGQLVWVAFDFASPRQDRATNPIPFTNQKGIVSADHKVLKDAAYFYRSYYTSGTESPMVYIVSKTWKDRIKKPGNYNIWAYSNCDSVVLYNGYNVNLLGTRTKSAGPSPMKDTRFQWDQVYIKDSILFAQGYVGGVNVITDTLIYNQFDPSDTLTTFIQTTDNITSDLYAYPNPMKDLVNIFFNVHETMPVLLTLSDLSGRTLETILDNICLEGQYIVEWNASKYNSGVYLCQLKYDKVLKTIKLVK